MTVVDNVCRAENPTCTSGFPLTLFFVFGLVGGGGGGGCFFCLLFFCLFLWVFFFVNIFWSG